MAKQEQNGKEQKKKDEELEGEPAPQEEEVNDKEKIQDGKQRGEHVVWSTS